MKTLWFRWIALLLGLTLLAGCSATERDKTIGVSITGLDHLAEHLSIQNFWVDGTSGHQAGKGAAKCAAPACRRRGGPA